MGRNRPGKEKESKENDFRVFTAAAFHNGSAPSRGNHPDGITPAQTVAQAGGFLSRNSISPAFGTQRMPSDSR